MSEGKTDVEPLDPYTFGPTQRCFGCGPHNPVGLRLRFVREGDTVVARFTPGAGYEGPPGVFHGGLQATLADEVAGWTVVGLLGRMGFTTSLSARYIRPMRIDQEIEARGRIASHEGNIVTVDVTLRQDRRTGLMSTVSYMLPDLAKAEAYLGAPASQAWHKLFGA